MFFLVTLLASVSAAQAVDRGIQRDQQEKRVALVIGNGEYQSSRLLNPVNDAKDITALLTQLGFEVISRYNANRRTMMEAIDLFYQQLARADVGLFYYAGHGMQVAGENYLLPVGSKMTVERDVEYEAVPVGRLLGRMEEAQNKTNIIILDACRNNPFARSFRSATQGLSQMEAPTGSFLIFATAPGATAADGSGRNGLFTGALLQYMAEPGLKIEEVTKAVRRKVVDESGGQQTPWQTSSLMGDFYFIPGAIASGSGTSAPEPAMASLTVVPTFPIQPAPQAPPADNSRDKDDIFRSILTNFYQACENNKIETALNYWTSENRTQNKRHMCENIMHFSVQYFELIDCQGENECLANVITKGLSRGEAEKAWAFKVQYKKIGNEWKMAKWSNLHEMKPVAGQVKLEEAHYDEYRVRYILADITTGGPVSYYAGYPNDPSAVEAVRRWKSGVRVKNAERFDRKIIPGKGWTIVYRGSQRPIEGMDVSLTVTDYDEQLIQNNNKIVQQDNSMDKNDIFRSILTNFYQACENNKIETALNYWTSENRTQNKRHICENIMHFSVQYFELIDCQGENECLANVITKGLSRGEAEKAWAFKVQYKKIGNEWKMAKWSNLHEMISDTEIPSLPLQFSSKFKYGWDVTLNSLAMSKKGSILEVATSEYSEKITIRDTFQCYSYFVKSPFDEIDCTDGIPMVDEKSTLIPFASKNLKEIPFKTYLFPFFSEQATTLGILVGCAGASGNSGLTLYLFDTKSYRHAIIDFTGCAFPYWIDTDMYPPRYAHVTREYWVGGHASGIGYGTRIDQIYSFDEGKKQYIRDKRIEKDWFDKLFIQSKLTASEFEKFRRLSYDQLASAERDIAEKFMDFIFYAAKSGNEKIALSAIDKLQGEKKEDFRGILGSVMDANIKN